MLNKYGTKRTHTTTFSYLIVIVCGLLLHSGLRLHRLDALPLFIDESLIVEWAEQTRTGSPIGFGYHGKFLLPWVSALFQPTHVGYWVVRYVTLLFVVVGAAGLVALLKYLYGKGVAWLSLLFVAVTPMLFFFDRMALTDTVLHTQLTLFVYAAVLCFSGQQPRRYRALLAGSVFVLALLAKSTALVMLPLPIVAAVLLPAWKVRARLQQLALLYGTIGVLFLPLYGLLRLRGTNYFGLAAQFSTLSEPLPPLTKMLESTQFFFEGIVIYFGLSLLVMLIGFALATWHYPRRSVVLLALIFGMIAAIIISADTWVTMRYWLAMVPVSIGLAVAGWVSIGQRLPRPIGITAAVLTLGFYVTATSFPFIALAYNTPESLPLPPADHLAYIAADSAGTGVRELAQELIQMEGDRVIVGAFPQCFTLGLYLPITAQLECIDVLKDDDRVGRTNAALERYDAPFYLVLEAPGYVGAAVIESVTLEQRAVFARPGQLVNIVLYDALPRG